MTDQPPVDGRGGALFAHTFQLAQLLKSADKALMLAHIDERLHIKQFEKHGKLWVGYPVADWHEQHFTWMGQSKIIRLLDSLADHDKLLIRTKERIFEDRPKYDRTWSYSLDYDALGNLLQVMPESLKTNRNKRLPADDPNRKLPTRVKLSRAATPAENHATLPADEQASSKAPKNAKAEQNATAAQGEQKRSSMRVIDTNMLSKEDLPLVLTPFIGWDKAHRLLSQHKGPQLPRLKQRDSAEGGYLYWLFGGETVARCTQAEFDKANQKQPSGKLTAYLVEKIVTLPRSLSAGGQ